MGTTVKSNKLFNAALFTEVTRAKNFTNLLTDGAPKAIDGKKSKQTSHGAPIVRITDLSKQAGDTVEVDIYHRLTGLPTMGDRKLEGRGESLTSASMELKINQGRHMVDAGGRMAQQRTSHNLQQIARSLLNSDNYYSTLSDETTLYHLAGGRGTLMQADQIVPLGAHPEFGDIMVNDITPPTFDRHFYGGDATSIDSTGAIDSTDYLSIATIEKIRLQLDEAGSSRMQPIRLASDPFVDADPLYVLYVSPRQFHNFKEFSSTKDLQLLAANAMQRSKGWNHPLFQGECFMWEGILIKKMSRYVEFAAGSTIDICTNSDAATVTQATAPRTIHRAILLGAQALAHGFGNVGKQDGSDAGFVGMTEQSVDHDNSKEISIRWMDGKKKIRFADKNGRINDHGVAVVDTAIA